MGVDAEDDLLIARVTLAGLIWMRHAGHRWFVLLIGSNSPKRSDRGPNTGSTRPPIRQCNGALPVARHDRCWAKHQSITDPAHRQAAADLRIAAQRTPATAVDAQVERRPLSDYDRLFGLDEVAA